MTKEGEPHAIVILQSEDASHVYRGDQLEHVVAVPRDVGYDDGGGDVGRHDDREESGAASFRRGRGQEEGRSLPDAAPREKHVRVHEPEVQRAGVRVESDHPTDGVPNPLDPREMRPLTEPGRQHSLQRGHVATLR